jgi:hypothetical protein
MDSP